MNRDVVAIVFTAEELELVVRALGELQEREGPSETAGDVLAMLDGALAPNAMDGFEAWLP